MKIISVVGARPNFMKIAPFIKAVSQYNEAIRELADGSADQRIRHLLVHTGQHYDDRMSRAFFEALGIPEADINLGIGSGTHAEQVGNTMIAFEQVLAAEKPDWVVVVGDVNATLACSVTARKQHIRLCHIEAGLRSGDETMPEEINRLVTDRLSNLLLIPDRLSGENLRKEGVPDHRIEFVGNIMIDTLEANREKAAKLNIKQIITDNILPRQPTSGTHDPASGNAFALMTIHRPSNVDRKEILQSILGFLSKEVAADMPVVWPIHPRTLKMMQHFGLLEEVLAHKHLILLHPFGYHEMLRMNMGARLVLTDSGGMQEECCVLGTPCLTLRWNTERPVTLEEHGGTCTLVGNHIENIRTAYHSALQADRRPQRPERWDGHAAMRCVEAIINYH